MGYPTKDSNLRGLARATYKNPPLDAAEIKRRRDAVRNVYGDPQAPPSSWRRYLDEQNAKRNRGSSTLPSANPKKVLAEERAEADERVEEGGCE